MQKSTITIDVLLDPDKIPQQINWEASDTSADMKQKAKAMCLAFWDAQDKSALRIDLWTKDMMIDEMGDFFYQMIISMADTFKRATQQDKLAEEMKTYAQGFIEKFRANLLQEQK